MNRKNYLNQNRSNGGHRDVKQLSKNKNRFSRLDPDISSRYEDLDDEVSVPVTSRLTTNHKARGNNPRTNPFQRNSTIANTGVRNAEIVNKIKVPFGARKYEVKWICRQLNQKIENFKPLLITPTPHGHLEFYIRDDDVAAAIQANSRRILHRESSSKVEFHVTKVPAPWMILKKNEIELIQKVVDRRYNAENRALDLSDFASDSEFTSRDMMMTMTKGNVMLAIVDRIDERYGNITALSLSNNRLAHLDYASAVVAVAKFVKVLDLSHNLIKSEAEFEKFGGLPVEQLCFEGNPLTEKMSGASDYLSFIHKTFPRVSALDGIAVTPLLQGPDPSEGEFAPFRAGYYENDQIRAIVENFIVEFFRLYDGPDGTKTRKSLVDAYEADNSTFTLAIQNIKCNTYKRYPSDECYDNYIRTSHNLLTLEKFNRNRSARVAIGSMDIAVALSKLPTTRHLMDTFIVDVFLFQNALLGFTVQGMFEDGDLTVTGKSPELNFFSRTFTVVPKEGQRVAVSSDMLFISSAPTEMLTQYKALLDLALKNGSASAPVNPIADASIGLNGMGFSGEPPADVKAQMIAAFSQYSGMIPAWSEKCLADFHYNFDQACQKFNEIKSNVPAEAFAR
ncbi:unnamed protein product [Caenorhabditis bovis]|uniref:Nuclear RNA export factor 1 n=1 Tax=Caenorhabditis bovis TaxID=2654633 RepID=A0A8S1ECB8_9PELO|nr:unnamed protein product [Caenorhabditis bovis]